MITPIQLKEYGLNETEAKVYLYLLAEGKSTPPMIARGAGILRTNAYNVLADLKGVGLIEEIKQGKRKAYVASDPASLLRTLDKKKETLEKLLPDLKALQSTQKNKPSIRFYDGWMEVKQIYRQLVEAEEVFGFGSTKSLSELDRNFFTNLLRDMKRHNIILHDILTYESGSDDGKQMLSTLGGLYDYELLPKAQGDQPTDILIWGDNIALITLAEPIFGTVLTSPLLAKTFRIIWQTMKRGLS